MNIEPADASLEVPAIEVQNMETARTQNRFGAVTALAYGVLLLAIGFVRSSKDVRFGVFMIVAGLMAMLIGLNVWKKSDS